MARIPNPQDPTLAAADAAIVANQERRHRKYLGMSSIGDECERRLWLRFRWAKTASFDALTLKRFEDGHRTEDLIVARIRAAGVEWHSHDDKGEQYGCSDLGGHFSGHYDGVVLGIVQAPTTWRIGEVKCSEKWQDIGKLKAKLGEKNVLAEWSPTYYAQAQCYMGYEGLERHYTVVTSPGGRAWDAVRTEFDPVAFMKLKAKAERIIFTDTAPARLGDATHWICRMCNENQICHGSELPERSCRGCIHSEVLREGGWRCAAGHAFGEVCPSHRYLPSMLNMTQIDVADDGVIVYRMGDGGTYEDSGSL